MKPFSRILSSLIVLSLLVACATTPVRRPARLTQAASNTQNPSGQVTQVPRLVTGKPNIVFILADDLNQDEIQYMPKVKALIADQGLTFSNYFVPESLCCPSRATTLRGQYPHNTGVLSNNRPNGGFAKFFNQGEENRPSLSGCKQLAIPQCWLVNI